MRCCVVWDYTKLKIKIIELKMTKTQFRISVGFSTVILAKINQGKKIDMDILWKICRYLNCDIGDIVNIVEEK